MPHAPIWLSGGLNSAVDPTGKRTSQEEIAVCALVPCFLVNLFYGSISLDKIPELVYDLYFLTRRHFLINLLETYSVKLTYYGGEMKVRLKALFVVSFLGGDVFSLIEPVFDSLSTCSILSSNDHIIFLILFTIYKENGVIEENNRANGGVDLGCSFLIAGRTRTVREFIGIITFYRNGTQDVKAQWNL